MRTPRLCGFALAVVGAALCSPSRVAACKFYGPPPTTFLAEYNRAGLVLLGRVTAVNAATAPDKGTSEFVIETPFKKHPLMAGKDRLTLPLANPDLAGKRFLIFLA